VRLVGPDGRDADEGTLWIRTPATMTGYLNLPDKTREVLTSDGWYISGDILRRDETGAYYFVGRADDMFVCGGENIYPEKSRRSWSVTRTSSRPVSCRSQTRSSTRSRSRSWWPGRQSRDGRRGQAPCPGPRPAFQHPRHVVFVPELPLASTGKVDRVALRRLALEHGQMEAKA